MNADQLKIVSNWANSYIEQIKVNMDTAGMHATRKTEKSLRFEVTDKGAKLIVEVFGRPYFATVETGRKPTPDKKPSRAMIDSIKEWALARGKPESAAWGIATNINKYGTKLWQDGGRKDIYSEYIPSFIDQLSEELGLLIIDQTLETLVKDGN